MNQEEFYKEVREQYTALKGLVSETETVQILSDSLEVSRGKVKKLLITLGLVKGKYTDQIIELRGKGMSLDEISQTLGLSKGTVTNNAPYEKSIYNTDEPDRYAKAMRELRQRRKALQEKIVKERRTKTMNVSDGLLRLRMELSFWDLYGDVKASFKKHGNLKVCDTITRDVVVPTTMTLCQLHFVIQKSFNWLWYHMHDFCLFDEDYEKIVRNKAEYKEKAGVLFSAGVEENEEYERDMRIEEIGDEGRGYKKLYNGKFPLEDPYYEEYEVCQKAAMSGRKFSPIEKGQLLERLSISEVFALADKIVYNYDYGDGNSVIITAKKDYDDLLEADLISVGEIEQQEGIAKANQGPALLFADGYDCVEDVGGADGLAEFFEGIKTGDEDLKEWARDLGWSPRKKNLKTFF